MAVNSTPGRFARERVGNLIVERCRESGRRSARLADRRRHRPPPEPCRTSSTALSRSRFERAIRQVGGTPALETRRSAAGFLRGTARPGAGRGSPAAVRGNSSSRATSDSGIAICPPALGANRSSGLRLRSPRAAVGSSCSPRARLLAPEITLARWARPSTSRTSATRPSPMIVAPANTEIPLSCFCSGLTTISSVSRIASTTRPNGRSSACRTTMFTSSAASRVARVATARRETPAATECRAGDTPALRASARCPAAPARDRAAPVPAGSPAEWRTARRR